MVQKLKTWAASRGRLAVLSATELFESRRFITGLRENGLLKSRVYRNYLAGLVKPSLGLEAKFKSIIMLSIARPAHALTFECESGLFSCFIPPTYVGNNQLRSTLLKDLRNFMGWDFPKISILRAPIKRLAVRSGLAVYGRNNITYSGEYGSYHQLLGFACEAELEPFCAGEQTENPRLPACIRCSACIRRCPTEAIDQNRFLIHAEKCFTLFTETPGCLPPVRNKLIGEMLCLVGCLSCQTVCPANRGRLKIEQAPVSFTAAETRHFLADNSMRNGSDRRLDPVWQGIRTKLKILGMLQYQNRIGRNLRFIMNIGKSK